MKKKSLLLAIAAMSMAAVGVGTVGTFAWYKAVNAGVATGLDNTAAISVAKTDYSANAIDLPVKVTAARYSGDATDLALIHYYANTPSTTGENPDCAHVYGSEAGYYYGFYDQNGENLTLVKKGYTKQQGDTFVLPGSTTDFAIVQVDITIDTETYDDSGSKNYTDPTSGTTFTATQLAKSLAGQNANVLVENRTGDRAKFFQVTVASNSSINQLPEAGGVTSANSNITLSAWDNSTSTKDNWKTTVYFGMYADGVGAVDTVAFSLGVNVTVRAPQA